MVNRRIPASPCKPPHFVVASKLRTCGEEGDEARTTSLVQNREEVNRLSQIIATYGIDDLSK